MTFRHGRANRSSSSSQNALLSVRIHLDLMNAGHFWKGQVIKRDDLPLVRAFPSWINGKVSDFS